MAFAAVAAVTERLALGTGVTLLIQRDVLHTARMSPPWTESPAVLDAYAEAGAVRATLELETLPEDEPLRVLDDLAKPAARYAG